MNILVTGGAGFIGSHFVAALLADEYPAFVGTSVTVIDKLTYAGSLANLPADNPRLHFVRGDICDVALLAKLVPHHDAVVHFAAESHVDRSLASASAFTVTNVLGTQTVLEACRRSLGLAVVVVSTDEVYGTIAEGSWTEDSPLLPNSPYAASKAGGDLIARSYWRTYDMDVRITRCSNNYGPKQHIEKLIPRFVTNLLQGLPVPLYGDGSNIREWIHVDDHCRGIAAVLDQGQRSQIYNIAGSAELTNLQVTQRLIDLCGADESLIEHVADRKGHDQRYCLDGSKIQSELGYRPQRSFDEGLAATVDWYRTHQDWWRPLLNKHSHNHTAQNVTV